nr:ORF2 [Torque teno felis virus]
MLQVMNNDNSSQTPALSQAVDTRFKLHEAFWKQMVSRTHSLFCNCGQFLKHFRGWQDSTTEKNHGNEDINGNGVENIHVNFDLGFVGEEEDALENAIRYAIENGELNKM